MMLLLAPAAAAQITVRPTSVSPGERKLTLSVTNDFQLPGVRSSVTQVEVEPSSQLKITGLEPHGRWTGRKVGDGAVWTGGSIGPGKTESFVLTVDVPSDADVVSFVATEHFTVPPRRVERNPLMVEVEKSGTSAALIAALAAAGGVALVAVALYAWRRRRLSLH